MKRTSHNKQKEGTDYVHESIIDRILLSKWFYLVIIILFTVSIWFVLCKGIIPLDKGGLFGDLYGGVLGTILSLLSVLIVVKTFAYQRIVTQQNNKQLETQRFNDLFFELLHLYQKETAELCGQIPVINKEKAKSESADDTDVVEGHINYNDKDFFDYEKQMMQDAFESDKSFVGNRTKALSYYMSFFIDNSTKMAAYFRTLYRIYDLIDNSKLDEDQKKNYLKIIRAQLTESELFFIRYNSTSYNGRNFIYFINKYNVLKHLPFFELLELKYWWNDIPRASRMGLSILFMQIKRSVEKSIELKESIDDICTSSEKYHFSLINKENKEIQLILTIKKKKENKYAELSALDNYEPKKIQQLMDCMMKEIFSYSNFEMYNKEAIYYSDPISFNNKDVVSINSCVKTEALESLKVKYAFNV